MLSHSVGSRPSGIRDPERAGLVLGDECVVLYIVQRLGPHMGKEIALQSQSSVVEQNGVY